MRRRTRLVLAATLAAALLSLATAPAALAVELGTAESEACEQITPAPSSGPGSTGAQGQLVINGPIYKTAVKEEVTPVVKLSGLSPGFTPTVPDSADPATIEAAVAPQLPAGSAFTVEVSEAVTGTAPEHETVVEVVCSENAEFLGDPRDLEADLSGTFLVEQGVVTVTDNEITLETKQITRTVTIDIGSLGPPEEAEPPDFATAILDGKSLHIRLKCPARFKPRCLGHATAITATRCRHRHGRRQCSGGVPITSAASAKQEHGKWKVVVLKVKPRSRKLVAAMAKHPGKKTLIVRQVLHARRFKGGRHQDVFHRYKVRSG